MVKKGQECSRVVRPKLFAYEDDDVTSDDCDLSLYQLLDSHHNEVTSSLFVSSSTETTSIPIQIKRSGKFNTRTATTTSNNTNNKNNSSTNNKNVKQLKPIIKRRKSYSNENEDKEIGDTSNYYNHHRPFLNLQHTVTIPFRRSSSTVSFSSVDIREYDQKLKVEDLLLHSIVGKWKI